MRMMRNGNPEWEVTLSPDEPRGTEARCSDLQALLFEYEALLARNALLTPAVSVLRCGRGMCGGGRAPGFAVHRDAVH
jgi:hypothetical protein